MTTAAMTELELLLLGVALGAIPSAELSRIVVAYLGKRLGVAPKEIRQYNDATDGDAGD
jgi:hypothetical protein